MVLKNVELLYRCKQLKFLPVSVSPVSKLLVHSSTSFSNVAETQILHSYQYQLIKGYQFFDYCESQIKASKGGVRKIKMEI